MPGIILIHRTWPCPLQSEWNVVPWLETCGGTQLTSMVGLLTFTMSASSLSGALEFSELVRNLGSHMSFTLDYVISKLILGIKFRGKKAEAGWTNWHVTVREFGDTRVKWWNFPFLINKKGSGCLSSLLFLQWLLKNNHSPRKSPDILILRRKVAGLLTFGTVNTYTENKHVYWK